MEHAIASQLFLYPDAPRVQAVCTDCNRLLGECEADFANDQFVQQAKKALYPISYRDRDRKGWTFVPELAHHHAKPGHQFLYGADGEVATVVAPEPSDAVWRAVGKSMLVFLSVLVGNDVFREALDPVRQFVHQGGSAWDAGLRRGPNPRGDRWDDQHVIRADRISPETCALFIDLFARYSFYLGCGIPLELPENAKVIVFRTGALERTLLVQCYGDDRKEIRTLRRWWDKQLVFKANFLRKLSRKKRAESNDSAGG